jgi:hypothetical protein
MILTGNCTEKEFGSKDWIMAAVEKPENPL